MFRMWPSQSSFFKTGNFRPRKESQNMTKVYCEECKRDYPSEQAYLLHTESQHPEVCW